MSSKKELAQVWVNGYSIAGAGVVIAAVFPGSTSAALVVMEGHMCHQIGKIYRGDDYSLNEAVAVAGVIGLASIAGQIIALEALNLIPFAGWALKAPIAAVIIKGLGELIIKFYEELDNKSLEAKDFSISAYRNRAEIYKFIKKCFFDVTKVF